jgi:putative restriction endonuclease
MTLDYYKSKFAKLRVDSKPYWPDSTFNQAPYKPILLLSIMDLMAQQVIDANMISLNADLVDAFDLYWIRIVGASRESNPVMPFNHMRSEVSGALSTHTEQNRIYGIWIGMRYFVESKIKRSSRV